MIGWYVVISTSWNGAQHPTTSWHHLAFMRKLLIIFTLVALMLALCIKDKIRLIQIWSMLLCLHSKLVHLIWKLYLLGISLDEILPGSHPPLIHQPYSSRCFSNSSRFLWNSSLLFETLSSASKTLPIAYINSLLKENMKKNSSGNINIMKKARELGTRKWEA